MPPNVQTEFPQFDLEPQFVLMLNATNYCISSLKINSSINFPDQELPLKVQANFFLIGIVKAVNLAFVFTFVFLYRNGNNIRQ